MDDDDGEASNTESQVLTDSESLKIHHNSTTDPEDFFSDDEKNEEKAGQGSVEERDDCDGEDEADDDDEEEEEEIYPENFPTRLPNPVFKGFNKKRLLRDDRVQTPAESSSSSNDEEKRGQNPIRGKITEYAQYLGLQPAAKYNKCSKCSVINSHRNPGRDECVCQSQMSQVSPVQIPEAPSPVPTTSDNPSTSNNTNNFRITRKVYLCAACGTYFENWNLFLHMREIHKRHICLFCLGMFGQAERLSHHLEKKHSVTETPFNSVEDFYNAFKGSCYLICCSCEKVFSETDNFYNHYCPASSSEEKSPQQEQVCSVCRQSGSHSATCPRQLEANKFLPSKPGGGKIRSKNNRVKRSEKHLLTSYQKKLSQLYERKMTLKTERQSLESGPSEPLTSEIICPASSEVPEIVEKPSEQSSLSRDTVAETIMQVSKISKDAGEVSSEHVPVIETKAIEEKPEEPARDNWDSVTDTIMRVSKFDEPGSSSRDRLPDNQDQDMSVDDSNQPDAPQNTDKRDESSSEDANDNENNENNSNVEEEAEEEEEEEAEEEEEEDDEDDDEVDEQEERRKKLESTPMSVSRVNRTKGSLVIKICTNKNSHYSVSTPNMNGVDDSEDNNNESDSDNDRLTVALAEDNKRVEMEPSASNFNDTSQLESAEMMETNIEMTRDDDIDHLSNLPEVSDGNDVEKSLDDDNIPLAGDDVPSIDLNVDGLLESLKVIDLLRGCIEAASPTCVYCNHARHIAVDGKQLALHMLAEHRFQPQHPAIIIQLDQFVNRVKRDIDELSGHYFNADSYDSDIGTYNVPDVRMYECFNCRVVSHIPKDLYLHNRKMHQKTILICVMCKSTFYNYSELLCHLCPGIYSANATDMTNQSLTSAIVNSSIKYRCCICTSDPLPSAFRLMVHLRKRHNACDVCLELNGNQQRLSNHVWKHKLHHLCYRCGIAYRNKPDITKHLFWKHGTESVLCKKCLQKKWPHIYHFCIPPSAFVCEECNVSFSKAVALKVHKRLHTKEEPYSCSDCQQRFISKKLLIRHEEKIHRPPPEPPEPPTNPDNNQISGDVNGLVDVDSLPESLHQKSHAIDNSGDVTVGPSSQNEPPVSPMSTLSGPSPEIPDSQKIPEPVRKVVDVYDLPPLNLSSESDSDDQDDDKVESAKKDDEKTAQPDDTTDNTDEIKSAIIATGTDDSEQVDIMNGIWDNFKSYATTTETNLEELAKSEEKMIETKRRELLDIITADHDYCVVYGDSKIEDEPENAENSPKTKDVGEDVNIVDSVNEPDQVVETEVTIDPANEVSISVDSDGEKKKEKSPKKKTNSNSSSSDSSSDSDSSSCSCGTNCSCSSSSSDSSSSSSSSSDSDSSASESPKKQSESRKRERKRTKSGGQHKRPKETGNENEEDGGGNAVTDADEELINVHTIDEPSEQHALRASPAPLPIVETCIMRESDLDTDETETDEDFYDEHPQELANKLLAEKRNQLMLLASVAAPEPSVPATLNNGTADTSGPEIQTQSSGKKRVKVKKRKKTSESRRGARGARGARGTRGRRPKYPGITTAAATSNASHTEQPPIKLHIPSAKLNRQKRPKIRFSSMVPPVNRAQSTEYPANNSHSTMVANQSSTTGYSGASGASGAEGTAANDNKRSSKRKRIPKKFYGDSSEDEQHQQNQYPKWRRIESTAGHGHGHGHEGAQQQQQGSHQYVPTITIKQNFGPPLQSKWYNAEHEANFVVYKNESAPSTHGASVTDTEEAVDETSASDSSGSDEDEPVNPPGASANAANADEQPAKRKENNYTIPGPAVTGDNKKHLYCYCQCPYDEVSEMIACDGSHCKIEWFHFECVGIMVPPKGKWYCPDCRKEDPTLKNDDFID